jgi:hypothetical protein
MRKVTKEDIYIHDSWIYVDGIGRIGMYHRDIHEIGLDWSMCLIVGFNKNIPCKEHEIKDKIYELFNP